MSSINYSPVKIARLQSGAVLYVALIVLLLLAMIGIIGMQVTGMQEKMSSNYRNQNIAFQNAESDARETEDDIKSSLWGGVASYPVDQDLCSPTFDPQTWAKNEPATKAKYTRRIDKCFAGTSVIVGDPTGGPSSSTSNIYQITVKRGDFNSNPSAISVIDTVYIP